VLLGGRDSLDAHRLHSSSADSIRTGHNKVAASIHGFGTRLFVSSRVFKMHSRHACNSPTLGCIANGQAQAVTNPCCVFQSDAMPVYQSKEAYEARCGAQIIQRSGARDACSQELGSLLACYGC